MSCNKEDILEYDNEVDYTNALDDSDVDEIEDEMKLTCVCDSGSEEYSYSDDDNEATFQTNRILESSTITKSNSGDHGRQIIERRGEESEEYSDDDNVYPSKIIITATEIERRMSEEKWIFVEPGADYRPTCIPDFNEPSGPTFSVSERAIPSDFYKKNVT